ncbi:hypothetical protein PJI16_19025 [Nitrospira sp. MA-1]|nr:hypothetical protein [Nitrospira sp. MA-1]
MKPVSIGNATSVYETASKCEITRHWVDHAGLADVSRSRRSLVQSLDSEAEEEFWQSVLGPVSRLAFALCSTPLPFDRAAVAACIDWDKLHRQVRLCQQLYPDSHAALASLVQKLQSLSAETGSPFTVPLELLHGKSGGLSVVLRNPGMNQAVAAYFADSAALRNATVVSARQLREAHLCDVLVAIGPCGWFPDYVFSAPRAAQIHVVSFRWIRDPWKPGPVFLNGTGSSADKSRKHYVGALPQLRGQAVPPTQTLPDLQPVDLLPPLPPLGQAGSHIPGWQPSAGDETLPARLCHLSGGRAVFVSADEGSSSLVIDLTETGDSVVRRVPADELELELYLLLRTSGGGDFIAPLADRILGPLAAERRAQQAGWKDRLVAAAQERFGPLSRHELAARVAGNLRSQNLSEARPANVHYWMSAKCIHPRKEEDFTTILAFAGMSDRTQDLWEAMGEIDRAHRRAGQAIRQMLLQKIATSSLEPLERDGEMVFDLDEQDGGTLSAFQITGISEEEYEIPADRIGVLLDSDE